MDVGISWQYMLGFTRALTVTPHPAAVTVVPGADSAIMSGVSRRIGGYCFGRQEKMCGGNENDGPHRGKHTSALHLALEYKEHGFFF